MIIITTTTVLLMTNVPLQSKLTANYLYQYVIWMKIEVSQMQKMHFEFRGIVKAWDPRYCLCSLSGFQHYPTRLWVVLSTQGLLVPPVGDALWGSRVSSLRLRTQGNGLCILWAFQWYLTWPSVGLYSEGLVGPPPGDTLWVQGHQ